MNSHTDVVPLAIHSLSTSDNFRRMVDGFYYYCCDTNTKRVPYDVRPRVTVYAGDRVKGPRRRLRFTIVGDMHAAIDMRRCDVNDLTNRRKGLRQQRQKAAAAVVIYT